MTQRLLQSLLVALIACSGGSDPTTPNGGSVTASSPTSTSAALPSTTTAAESSPTTAPPDSTDSCLVGDWILETESFAASLETAMRAGGGEFADLSATVTGGGGRLSFDAGGAAAGGYDGLTVAVDMGIEAVPILEIIITGDINGTYTLDGNTLTLSAVESNFDLEAFVGGAPFDSPIPPELIDFGSSVSTITCDGDRLVIEPQVDGAAATVWLRA